MVIPIKNYWNKIRNSKMNEEWLQIKARAEVSAKVAMRPVSVTRVIRIDPNFTTCCGEELYEIKTVSGERFIVPFQVKETIYNPSR